MEEHPKNHPNEFLKYLVKITEPGKEDRAALADLRCGFSKATEVRAWVRIGAFCHLDWEEDRIVFQTIGAGYATNPNNDDTNGSNFGNVARKLSDEYNSFDFTFRRILSCRTKRDVCQCLRSSILATKAKDIPVPWKSLLWDLLKWESEPEKIKGRWAEAYWPIDEETEVMDSPDVVDKKESNTK